MEHHLLQFFKKPTVFRPIIIIGLMMLSFGLGVIAHYYATNNNNSPVIEIPERPIPLALQYGTPAPQNVYDVLPAQDQAEIGEPVEAGDSGAKNFVASKSGTKYYPAGCSGIDRIKPENRIYFATEKAAEEKGYARTETCKE